VDESLMVAIVMVTAAVVAFELRVSSAILEILAGIGLAFFFRRYRAVGLAAVYVKSWHARPNVHGGV
jgi:hypothetical protein